MDRVKLNGPKSEEVEIGDTRERSIHSHPKAGQQWTSTVVSTPSLSQVLQCLWRSQNIHMKRWVYNIQCYWEGHIHHTLYTIQTGVYTAFSISRGGIYTIQFTFPTPINVFRAHVIFIRGMVTYTFQPTFWEINLPCPNWNWRGEPT